MKSFGIANALIDGATYEGEGSSDIRWDAALPGFGVRIYPSGKKSFVLSYRVKRRKHLMALGRCDILTLDQARAIARERLAGVIIEGTDPLDVRRKSASMPIQEGQPWCSHCGASVARRCELCGGPGRQEYCSVLCAGIGRRKHMRLAEKLALLSRLRELTPGLQAIALKRDRIKHARLLAEKYRAKALYGPDLAMPLLRLRQCTKQLKTEMKKRGMKNGY